MRKYESVVVFTQILNDQQLSSEAAAVRGVLESSGARDITAENWGRRQLAYPVKKERYGIYTCFNYGSDRSETVKDLHRALSINTSVLKFQTHRTDIKTRVMKRASRSSYVTRLLEGGITGQNSAENNAQAD